MLPAYRKALRDLYTADVNKLLLDLREYRKRINRFLVENENSPALRLQQDRALTASTLASSRMDGNDVSESRLIELAKQDTEPTSNKEREAMGARFAISTVEDNFRFIRVSTGAISQLHRDFFRYSTDSDGGRWADNDSPAFYASELNRMSARRFGGELATKRALLRDACDNYRQAVARREFDPLVEACMFTLDVLNIQPFASGNGRLARLLFQMLAYQNGYMAPRYVSICERLERLGEKFELTVAACPRVVPAGASEYDAETNYEPFVLMMLEALLDCCREFESQYKLDSVSVDIPEEPEPVQPEPKANGPRRSRFDISLEERLALRAEMQATSREILRKAVNPAFSGIPETPKAEQATAARSAAATPAAPAPVTAPAQPAASAAVQESEKQAAAPAADPADAAGATEENTETPTGAQPEAVNGNSPANAPAEQPETIQAAASAQTEETELPEGEHTGSNEEVVRAFFDGLQGDAAKKDVVAACPNMSAKTVERMIQKLLAEGYIQKLGAARATTYRKA